MLDEGHRDGVGRSAVGVLGLGLPAPLPPCDAGRWRAPRRAEVPLTTALLGGSLVGFLQLGWEVRGGAGERR